MGSTTHEEDTKNVVRMIGRVKAELVAPKV
jgi:hypothetical protein